MHNAATVAKASTWADQLLRWESRGPGDTNNALRRLSRKTGVSYATFWALRYRTPKDIYVSVYNKLSMAYEAERQRQLRLLTHEIETTAARAGADCASVRAAEALVGAAHEQEPTR